MATRSNPKQSEHDAAIRALKNIYQDQYHMVVVTNPGSTKNLSWNGRYIDVIVRHTRTDQSAWVIEVETDGSVSETEATNQWVDYDAVYEAWHLAVPASSKAEALRLIKKYKITHCYTVTWKREPNGSFTFWNLPGV